MSDTIDRQAAIDMLKNRWKKTRNYEGIGDDIAEECELYLKQVPPAQPERIQNNAVHLCDSCQYTYMTCPSHGNDAVFGDGKGNDNICACNKYRPISAQPERKKGKWIPCSERLPEKYGNYLVTTDDGEVDIGSCDPENKDRQDHFWGGCDADGFFWYGENIVIAWMPLPKSYMRGE